MSTTDLKDRLAEAVSVRENGRPEHALELGLEDEHLKRALLTIVATTTADPVVGAYRGAIETYAADLDRTWP